MRLTDSRWLRTALVSSALGGVGSAGLQTMNGSRRDQLLAWPGRVANRWMFPPIGYWTRRARRRWTRGWLHRALVVLALLGATRAAADDPYDVPADPIVSLRAVVDLRIVRGTRAPSWQEGGPGSLRYGGRVVNDGELDRVARFAISQLALEPTANLPWGIRAHAQVNWEGDIDDTGDTSPNHDVMRLIEGYLRRDWGSSSAGWGVLAGVSNPAFSLEHTGPAWTPNFTLTPSALNTWLWEDGRVLGLEGEWWTTRDGVDLATFGGVGWGPDRMGILLAQRGWVLSDYLNGINNSSPLPNGTREDGFDERDGRPVLYAGASLGDPWKIGKLNVGYFDNLGNLAVAGVWEMRYGIAGVALQPVKGVDLLFQYLIGKTATRANHLSSTVQALYPLISYRWRTHRVTFRYDHFRVRDDDGPPDTRERGHAYTVSYLFEFGLHHRVGCEYIAVDSTRAGVSPPGDDGWQISYRFRY